MQVIPPGVFVGIADLKGPSFFITQHDFSVHYDHFVEGMEIPKGYQKRDRLDQRTTQEVEATAVQYVSTMEAGETLEVVKLQMLKRGKHYMVDLLLRAIAARHLSVRARQAAGATIVARNDVGVHFRFYFPPEVGESGDYDAIVATIDRYLLPKAEYEAGGRRPSRRRAHQRPWRWASLWTKSWRCLVHRRRSSSWPRKRRSSTGLP